MVQLDILQVRQTRKFRSTRLFSDQEGQISQDTSHAACRTIDLLAPEALKCLSVNRFYAGPWIEIWSVQWMPLNWTNALTSYYTKLRRFSADLVGFGPLKVSHVGKPELDQICRTHGD